MKEDFARIKESVSISDVARAYTGRKLETVGIGHRTSCPFHDDSTASLYL